MAHKMKPALTFLRPTAAKFGAAYFGPTVIATAVLMSLAACSGSKWHEVAKAPNTGDPIAEKQVAPPAEFHRGDTGFVAPTHLPARTSTDQPAEKAPSHLERNDKIEVTNPNPDGDSSSMEAVVTSSGQPEMVGKKVIVAKKYVSAKPIVPTNEENDADKYFVIQNIATEKLRVYRNCASKDAAGDCVNKLVFETEMTAGEPDPTKDRRTILGSYRVDSWHKFYEDHAGYFPSFYNPTYPATPKVGASMQDWMDSKYLPKKGGVMRGSFGWYTSYLTPNASAQWTHGTFGWGEDGEKFIFAMKDGQGIDERSQGCTRVENQAIALMREILPRGSRMVKIYAREALADKTLARYNTSGRASWKWVLTKMRSDDAPKSGAKWASGVGSDEILDKGSYVLDQHPDVAHGDLYNVGADAMTGVFLIDEGTLLGYKHPSALKVGGESDHSLPSVMISHRTKESLRQASASDAASASASASASAPTSEAQATPVADAPVVAPAAKAAPAPTSNAQAAPAQPAAQAPAAAPAQAAPAPAPAAQPAPAAPQADPNDLKNAPAELAGAAQVQAHGFVRPDQQATAAAGGQTSALSYDTSNL